MRSILAQSLVWGACLIGGLMVRTGPSVSANCALYARAETGVALYGDAGGWWDQAQGRYQRGHVPDVGAILVFKRSGKIPSGHVAVVARIVSAHEILVDHANWYHGTVSRGMSVIDTSPSHDWTSVAVMNPPSGTHGRDYATYGFVYPGPRPPEIIETRDAGGLDSYAVDGSLRPNLLQFAVATEDWQTPTTTRRHHHSRQAAAHPTRKQPASHGHHHSAARGRPSAPAKTSRAGIARPPTRPLKTAEAKHHRA